MLKAMEAREAGSCWNRAHDDELIFVLLERDAATAETIEFWCSRRIAMGKNAPGDPQIKEAESLAHEIRHRHLHGTQAKKSLPMG